MCIRDSYAPIWAAKSRHVGVVLLRVVAGVPGAGLQRLGEAGGEGGAGAAARGVAGVGPQQPLRLDVEAVARVALEGALDPGPVEVPGPGADHVEPDPVFGQVLECPLLARHTRVDVQRDRVKHLAVQRAVERGGGELSLIHISEPTRPY